MVDLMIGMVIAILAVLVIRKLYRDKKSGKTCCGGGSCGGCGGGKDCVCGPKDGNDQGFGKK